MWIYAITRSLVIKWNNYQIYLVLFIGLKKLIKNHNTTKTKVSGQMKFLPNSQLHFFKNL